MSEIKKTTIVCTDALCKHRSGGYFGVCQHPDWVNAPISYQTCSLERLMVETCNVADHGEKENTPG